MTKMPAPAGDLDVAVIGGGAAGLMAAIFAARKGARVDLLDGASRLGAKILISGGGRCNVTHDVVRPEDFNGNRNAIAKVLRTFDVAATTDFFASIGVELKREEGGKLFPVSDRARTVLDALVQAARDAGVEFRTGHRVEAIERDDSGEFMLRVAGTAGVSAARVVLATGGRSIPKTGSDGAGYELARSLGHSVTPTFPALVPLVLHESHWLRQLSGTSVEAVLSVRAESGRVLHRERGSTLFTHFGLSGPAVLDISRHWIASRPAELVANLLPESSFESLEAELTTEAKRNPRATVASFLRGSLPERLIDAVAQGGAGIASSTALSKLTRETRRQLVRALVELPLPVIRDRGFEYAEVTAGGVPLSEMELRTMASRVCGGLFLCGEILDVDGKIGGYNFQWAWSSGRLAGIGAAK